MIFIKDINDDRIIHYRNLRKTPALHTQENIFVGEGLKVCLKLLNSAMPVLSIFAMPEYYDKYRELISTKNIPENMLFAAEKNIMNKVIGFKIHTGFMAIGKQPEPTPPDNLSNRIIAMNGIIDSENVGSIIRNSAAFGFNSIITDSETSSPYLRRAVRVSMGTVFDMKICPLVDFIKDLYSLKERGYSIIAAEIAPESKNVVDFHFPDKFVLIFGTESHGVSEDALNICDNIIHIPISPNVSSLNVAASSAIFMNLIANNGDKK